jgi:hypothetical protein
LGVPVDVGQARHVPSLIRRKKAPYFGYVKPFRIWTWEATIFSPNKAERHAKQAKRQLHQPERDRQPNDRTIAHRRAMR